MIDVYETNRKVAFAHKIQASQLDSKIDEITTKIQNHIDSN